MLVSIITANVPTTPAEASRAANKCARTRRYYHPMKHIRDGLVRSRVKHVRISPSAMEKDCELTN